MSTDSPAEGARPPATSGMRHVALFVKDLKETADFYVTVGMTVEWRRMTITSTASGNDNLALHRADESPARERWTISGFSWTGRTTWMRGLRS